MKGEEIMAASALFALAGGLACVLGSLWWVLRR